MRIIVENNIALDTLRMLRKNEYSLRLNVHEYHDRGLSLDRLNYFYLQRARNMISSQSLLMFNASVTNCEIAYLLDNDYSIDRVQFVHNYNIQIAFKIFVECKNEEQLNYLRLVFDDIIQKDIQGNFIMDERT